MALQGEVASAICVAPRRPPQRPEAFCFVRFRSCFISHWSLKQRNREVRSVSFVWAVIFERRAFEQLVTDIDSRHSPAVLWEESPDAMCGTCQWSSPHVVHSVLCSPPGASRGFTGSDHRRFYCRGRSSRNRAGLIHNHYKRDGFESVNPFFWASQTPKFEVRKAQRRGGACGTGVGILWGTTGSYGSDFGATNGERNNGMFENKRLVLLHRLYQDWTVEVSPRV